MSKRAYGERKAPVTSSNIKEEVLDKVLENPHNSTKSTAQQVGMSQFSVVKTFEEESVSPYHISYIRNCMRQTAVIKWYTPSGC
jgi:hypothetical protein